LQIAESLLTLRRTEGSLRAITSLQATQKSRDEAERLPLCGPSAGSIEVFA
jgi:hypothetical protein